MPTTTIRERDIVVVKVGGQPGPRGEIGPQGPPGASGGIGALAIDNRLSEFGTQEAKAAARANLELQYIDGGTFN